MSYTYKRSSYERNVFCVSSTEYIVLNVIITKKIIFFFSLNKNERDEIEIKDFLYFIDICLSVGDKKMLHLNILNTHASESNHHQQLIDWSAFIDELGLEEELKQGVE